MLRIAMLSYHTCPLATLGGKDTGGMNVYVRDLTRALGAIASPLEMGIHVDVFTRSQDEHIPHVLHDLGYGNRVVHVAAGPEECLSKDVLASYLPEFVKGIQDFADQKGIRYDLIHSHYWMSGLAALDLRAAWGTPIVHMFHTLGVMKNRVARQASQLEGDYRIQGERRVLQNVDRVVVATTAEMVQLQWLYQADTQKMVEIPPGVETSRFYPIPQDEAKEFIGMMPCDRMLLFVGRIEPLKGLDVLIQALIQMRRQDAGEEALKGMPICLAVIGGDPDASSEAMTEEMARIQDMRQQYGLEDMVVFLGRRGQETLPYYYSAAEAVVVPSHYESFGLVALEAMACGTPVVASQVGGLAFLVQDGVTGYHVPVGEPDALCDRLTALFTDAELRTKLGQQAATFARQYAWDKIATRILALYEDVIKPA